MENVSPVSKWPFQHTKMAILRKWGYVLKWQFWGNWGMVANSANIGAFYTILTNIWHPWRSWVRLHMEVQLVLWEKFESNLLVWNASNATYRIKDLADFQSRKRKCESLKIFCHSTMSLLIYDAFSITKIPQHRLSVLSSRFSTFCRKRKCQIVKIFCQNTVEIYDVCYFEVQKCIYWRSDDFESKFPCSHLNQKPNRIFFWFLP